MLPKTMQQIDDPDGFIVSTLAPENSVIVQHEAVASLEIGDCEITCHKIMFSLNPHSLWITTENNHSHASCWEDANFYKG